MILGMWKPDSGVVELDGKNVFELDNDDIGQYLGYLPQNVELFAGSVKDNYRQNGGRSTGKRYFRPHTAPVPMR